MMTKDEIKKALRCCSGNSINDCKDCPYNNNSEFSCANGELYKDALNLITEQEKEIDALKAENEELTKVVSSKVYDLIDNTKEIADAREAWEKQAKIDVLNELKEKYGFYSCYSFKNDVKSLSEIIDELLKEYENE